jgi:biopolymer transport protein ExbD
MVELGFLLITFFVFTTSISKPTVINLTMPYDDTDNSLTTAAEKTISLLLADENRIYYFNGDSINKIHSTNYSPQGLRSVLLLKKTITKNKFGDASETVVLIKPTAGATYENIVDALDEMQINQITRYVLMDANKNETAFLINEK